MIIRVFILSFVCFTLIESNDNYQLKLYEKIFPAVYNSKNLYVYADKQSKNILKRSEILILVENCNIANLLIGEDFDYLSQSCLEKPIFHTSYRSYKKAKTPLGAFYWRKGRPQLKINKSTIDRFNLKLPNSLRKYSK